MRKGFIPKITKEQFETTSPHYCNCGCHREIIWKNHFRWKGIPRCLSGHGCRTKKEITREDFDRTGPHYCECICHQEIQWKEDYRRRGRIPRYKEGHNGNTKKINIKIGITREDFEILQLRCHCPCNQLIPWKRWYKNRGIPQYLHHHHPGTKPTKETRDKIGERNKGKHRGEDTKNKISISKKGKYVGENSAWYGKHHTPESNEKNRQSHIGKLPHPSPNNYRGKGCHYNSPLQNKMWLRSSYEIEFARLLDMYNILWIYEAITFPLSVSTYTPDFYLPQYDKFIEIKGYMRPESKVKIEQFQTIYPWTNLKILYKQDLLSMGCYIN